MKNMLAAVAALVITVLVVGFSLGWFQIAGWSHSSTGQSSVNISIDGKKFGTDVKKGGAQIQKIIEKAANEESETPPK